MRKLFSFAFSFILTAFVISLAMGAVVTPALAQSDSPTGSINWATPYVSLTSNPFSISTPNGTFVGSSDGRWVQSDPGSDTYTTLEATWHEHGVEMRMFIYFAQENGQWRVTELRTYDGNQRGEWIYYDGTAFGTQAVGQAINKDNFTLTSRDGSGHVSFGTLQLQAFLPHPSPSLSPAGYYIEPKPYGTVAFGVSTPNSGYNIIAVVRNTQGQIVTDQSDFHFTWTSQDPTIVTVQPDSVPPNGQCILGIQSPCPQLWGSMKGIRLGTTTVTVEVRRISNNEFIGSYQFPIEIINPPIGVGDSTLVGDLNNDGKVNLLDYAILVHDLFKVGSDVQSDLNQDGKVNLLDYSMLIERLRALD